MYFNMSCSYSVHLRSESGQLCGVFSLGTIAKHSGHSKKHNQQFISFVKPYEIFYVHIGVFYIPYHFVHTQLLPVIIDLSIGSTIVSFASRALLEKWAWHSYRETRGGSVSGWIYARVNYTLIINIACKEIHPILIAILWESTQSLSNDHKPLI